MEGPSRQWRGGSPTNAAELASRSGVHSTMIHQWSREDQKTFQWIVFPTDALLEGASGVYERGGRKKPEIDADQVKDLHAKIVG